MRERAITLATGRNNTQKSWRTDKRKTAERGYGSAWQRARAAYLDKYPLCAMCEAEGRVEAATVVDHIKPHEGDKALFWDRDNWQALCKRCHDSDKQRMERGGCERTRFDGNGRVIW